MIICNTFIGICQEGERVKKKHKNIYFGDKEINNFSYLPSHRIKTNLYIQQQQKNTKIMNINFN